jgi:hypothetical protein
VPFDVVGDVGFDANDSRNFFGSKGTTRKAEKILNRKACQYLAIAMRKTDDEDPVGSAYGANRN